MILDSKKIPYETVDIGVSSDLRDEMRELSGIPNAVVPRFFKDNKYLGVCITFICN